MGELFLWVIVIKYFFKIYFLFSFLFLKPFSFFIDDTIFAKELFLKMIDIRAIDFELKGRKKLVKKERIIIRNVS